MILQNKELTKLKLILSLLACFSESNECLPSFTLLSNCIRLQKQSIIIWASVEPKTSLNGLRSKRARIQIKLKPQKPIEIIRANPNSISTLASSSSSLTTSNSPFAPPSPSKSTWYLYASFPSLCIKQIYVSSFSFLNRYFLFLVTGAKEGQGSATIIKAGEIRRWKAEEEGSFPLS